MYKFIISCFLIAAPLPTISEEFAVVFYGIIGAIVGILYNAEIIRDTKLKGIAVAIGAVVVWITAMQASLHYWNIHYKTASFFATFGGFLVFGFANWVLQNQNGLTVEGKGILIAYLVKKLGVAEQFKSIELKGIDETENPKKAGDKLKVEVTVEDS